MKKRREKPEFNIDDRGFNVKAWYLDEPEGGALIEISRDASLLRRFTFPAYKIWNIAAHFSDIVDGELVDTTDGYAVAASDGLGGHASITPVEE